MWDSHLTKKPFTITGKDKNANAYVATPRDCSYSFGILCTDFGPVSIKLKTKELTKNEISI